MPSTLKPVTIGGWYECDDGSIVEIRWIDGRQVERRRVASWADVPTQEEEDARIDREP